MDKKLKLFEDFADQDECFMITYGETGDEVHMILMSMEHFDRAVELMLNQNEFWQFVENNSIKKPFRIQTYTTEEYPFSDYKIVKVMSVPYE